MSCAQDPEQSCVTDWQSLIDHESFLSFGVALTFLTLGVVGTIGSDDILCCFIVGNSFTWDDWFRVQTEDHKVQDVIDQLLNVSVKIGPLKTNHLLDHLPLGPIAERLASTVHMLTPTSLQSSFISVPSCPGPNLVTTGALLPGAWSSLASASSFSVVSHGSSFLYVFPS